MQRTTPRSSRGVRQIGRGTEPGRPPPAPTRSVSLPAAPATAALPLVLVTAVLGWWAWERGAYFGVNFLPGAMALLALLGALLLFAPWPARLRGPAAVSLVSLAVLSGWTLLSGLWSPAPDIAVEDAGRVLTYAVAFALGLWTCLLLGRRMLLLLAVPAVAGAVVAVGTLIALWVGTDAAELLEIDATLRYPLGYRNAVAAFFMITLWPMLVLAASRDLDWRLRGALLAAGTLAIELTVLSQSRGSLFATAVGGAVLIAAHPARLRIIGMLALASVPAALSLPLLLDVFQSAGGNTESSLDPLRTACAAMAVTTALSACLGLAVSRAEPGLRLSPATARRIGLALATAASIALLVGAIAMLRADGGPLGFIKGQTEDLTAGTPDLQESGSRFGLDLRSDRGDLWRVALDDLKASPLTGEGAGGWRFSYLLDRESTLQPEDPHSVELLMASELGLPGLILFGGFAIGALLAVLRARRLGPAAAALAAGALAATGYWFVHASVEWFWSYPALTMPVAFLLGGAAAPALLRPGAELRRGVRLGLAAGSAVAIILLVPLFISERLTNEALREWRADLTGAYSDLGTSADLNPLSDRPLVAEAVIAESAGEPQRALAALAAAQGRQPDEWTLYYLEARVLGPIDEAGAARAIARARELNPRGEEIDELEGASSEP